VSEGAIEARVRQLAEQINKEYKGKSIVVIGILKGSVMFMTDLVKRLHVDAKIEFMVLPASRLPFQISRSLSLFTIVTRYIGG
jgi:hypoxanthine-guanine phosphoribosyltransferase